MSAVKTNINKMAAQQSPDMCDFKGCRKTFRKEIRLIEHKQKTETGKMSGETSSTSSEERGAGYPVPRKAAQFGSMAALAPSPPIRQ